MTKKHYNKIHFETMCGVSEFLIKELFNASGNFCDVIDSIHKQLQVRGESTIEAFKYDKACQAYLDGIYRKTYKKSVFDLDINTIRAAFWEVYAPYLFNTYGKKIFRLSKELTHMLMNTDFKKVDSFFLELPYKCIYVAIPKEIELISPFGLPINGIYLALLKDDDVKYEALSKKYHHYKDVENVKSFIIVAVSDVVLQRDDPRESMYYWHLIFEEGDMVTQLEKYINTWTSMFNLEEKGLNKIFINNIFSFVINTVLYINSSETHLVEQKPKVSNLRQIKNKKKKKALQRTSLPYYSLGTDIIIDHHYTKIINLSINKQKEYKRHAGQWMVRGHWRNQAIGPGRKKRKLTWVQPYVKGEEFSNFISKEYKVK